VRKSGYYAVQCQSANPPIRQSTNPPIHQSALVAAAAVNLCQSFITITIITPK